MKKLLTIIALTIGFGINAQDYSFSSAVMNAELRAESIAVDDIRIDNTTIGLSTDLDLFTLSDGLLTIAGEVITSSDARLKANIISFGPALAMISLLKPKKYTMLADKTAQIKIGLLAQDIQKVFPELVSISSNEMLAVNYQGLVPVLINSVNELSVKNSELQTRIKKLRKLISKK
jgi:hypothetical protein